jgi:uncharacterized protein (TIGR00255 family)
MILSMTGFGQAEARADGVTFRAEVRSLNNRYFKATIKLPETFQRFEGDIDRLLRSMLGRGSITYNLRIKDENAPSAYQINTAAVKHYVDRLREATAGQSGIQIDLAGLLEVPGVCEPADIDPTALDAQFRIVDTMTREAVERVIAMRRAEGAALQKDLEQQCASIRLGLEEVARRAPGVVEEYHKRLKSRVQQLVASASVELDQDALAREVAIFAERCDVNEEVSRLASHLDQFAELCGSSEEAGRKLDFLTQEMLREANTIGSKANDAQLARHVVEIKAAIDRIKEQVQNVE